MRPAPAPLHSKVVVRIYDDQIEILDPEPHGGHPSPSEKQAARFRAHETGRANLQSIPGNG